MRKFTALILCLLMVSGMSLANGESVKSEDTEIIEVTGQVPTFRLRKMALQAKLDFYDAYNRINENRDYEIICSDYQKTGSRFTEKRCTPRYLINISNEMLRNQAFQRGLGRQRNNIGGRPPQLGSFVNASLSTKKKADAHMLKLIQENDELWDKYQTLLKLHTVYENRTENSEQMHKPAQLR